jgi:hypothetical protein
MANSWQADGAQKNSIGVTGCVFAPKFNITACPRIVSRASLDKNIFKRRATDSRNSRIDNQLGGFRNINTNAIAFNEGNSHLPIFLFVFILELHDCRQIPIRLSGIDFVLKNIASA